MNTEEAAFVQRIEDRAKSNTHRIARLEEQIGTVAQISQSICVIAEKLNVLNLTLEKLEGKVASLESAPAKRWERVSLRVLEALAAALAGFLLARLGINI